ncbi:MAG: hypothetical protein QG635_913, partial [Bacteroidota bacterium]|nr:hypothetical protein [Bacteroidota bacterium]
MIVTAIILLASVVYAQDENVWVQVINNVPDPNVGKMKINIDGMGVGNSNGYSFRQAS